jgi:hypothetical protein
MEEKTIKVNPLRLEKRLSKLPTPKKRGRPPKKDSKSVKGGKKDDGKPKENSK